MKLWLKLITDSKITAHDTVDFPQSALTPNWLRRTLQAPCAAMDIAVPVILKKHMNQLKQFSHTAFKSADFIEPITFDRFEIELIAEKK